MKFKEMRTEQKVLFITNIVFALYAVVLFVFGLMFNANSNPLVEQLYGNNEYATMLISSGIDQETSAQAIKYLFGFVCGVAVIYGILSFLGINAARKNKPKGALITFSIFGVIVLLTLQIAPSLLFIVISIVSLVIMLVTNKKETTITNENE